MSKKIRISAPARLHLGFLDLNGNEGRKFGSIGMAINSHHTTIEAELASTVTIHSSGTASTSSVNKVRQLVTRFYDTIGQDIPTEQQGVTLSLIELTPQHAGLGSGTQLALTIGTLLCRLHHITSTSHEIAYQLGRGSRSGIGIATFDTGGFIVDGGLNQSSLVPPVLAQHDYPAQWRIVLITESDIQGIHGNKETTAFTDLPEFPQAHSYKICHLTLMQLLPALIEQDIDSFGHAITGIQTLIGDHFAPAQGGRYTSPHIATLLAYAQSLGHMGIAQSSWGPTGCIFVDSDDAAKDLSEKLVQFANNKQLKMLSISTTRVSKSGAQIGIVET